VGLAAFDEQVLAEARAFNRKLAWAPRFKIRNRVMPLVIQSLLRLSQIGGARALAKAGVVVEQRFAEHDGGPVRVRVPLRILRGAGPVRGVVLDFHGGGWVIGNARMDDALNMAMIAACDVLVVSVDYRLVVSTPLAGVMDDCLAAARWLLDGGLPEFAHLPVYVVGESAGGHLAAATLLRLKAWPALLARIDGAILYYGVYDLAGSASVRGADAGTLVLDGPGMVAGLRMLTPGLSDAERRTAPLSPLYGELSGLPDALMFAGERDPVRDDSTEMALRWGRVAGVEMHLVPEAPHGFIRFPTRMAGLVTGRAHEWLRDRLRRSRAARTDGFVSECQT
jgi:acetyl esterase/lipase